ncbi:uncharacterized protein SAPINGB_P000797 [Magnusiomyces paraingens]|uniref:NYN domain-containing protein n=1 Tax=Magnusiomyces paraingens TaxID=2606893 RepID=A0A5E8B2C6_9ASCO|nr:uncharacterized protein SAPINGB_P000797 [Saprochaete ingens]VVT45573.1 unnamed protein product [Saprochaete ingens]
MPPPDQRLFIPPKQPKDHHHSKPQSPQSIIPPPPFDESPATRIARYTNLYTKIIQIFPKDKSTLLVPKPKSAPSASNLHVFVDLSNVYIGLCKTIETYLDYYYAAPDLAAAFAKKPSSKHIHPLDMEALDKVLLRGRAAAQKVVVGSTPTSASNPMHAVYGKMFAHARKLHYDVTIMSRVETYPESSHHHKEHGVDELLSVRILQTVRQTQTPGTIVLATGDGQPPAFTNGGAALGFLAAVEKALAEGWAVELYSFGASLSGNWRRLLRAPDLVLARFRIVYLDEFVLGLAAGPVVAALRGCEHEANLKVLQDREKNKIMNKEREEKNQEQEQEITFEDVLGIEAKRRPLGNHDGLFMPGQSLHTS